MVLIERHFTGRTDLGRLVCQSIKKLARTISFLGKITAKISNNYEILKKLETSLFFTTLFIKYTKCMIQDSAQRQKCSSSKMFRHID